MAQRAIKPSPVTMRPIEPRDEAACDAIYRVARQRAFSWCPPSMFTQGEFQHDSAHEVTWVAEEDGVVAGFLTISPPERFIHLLFVDPQRHRRGIGTALLGQAAALMGPAVWLKCQTGNVGALAFYRARGWSVLPGGCNEIGPWCYVSAAGVSGAPAPSPAE